MNKKETVEEKKIKKFGEQSDKDISKVLNKSELNEALQEKLLLELNEVYRERVEKFKEGYHKYAQSGRYVTSTYTRKIRKRDYICYINLETDLLLVERVQWTDGVTVKSRRFEYDVSLIKTIEVKLVPFINPKSRIVIHLAIANTESLDIAGKLRGLAESVFMKTILRYQDRKIGDKPIAQILIAGLVFGVVMYFALIQVFKKAILKIIGQLTLVPPE